MFAMSLYLLYDGTHATMDKVRCRFFWEGVGDTRKFHMVNWATVCKPKELGGLGILNTKLMNIALLSKWVWKLSQHEQGLWADLLRAKYLPTGDIFTSPTIKGSQFWNGLQKIKHLFKLGAKHEVHNGRATLFWSDWWKGRTPLRERFPCLYSISSAPHISIHQAHNQEGWRLTFRHTFGTAEAVEWDELSREIETWSGDEGHDNISWTLESSGCFSSRSIYLKLCQGTALLHFKDLWKAWIPPLKVKIFLWQMIRDKLPSCEQVWIRHGPSNGNCALCGELEDADHIFFSCFLARFMWACVRETFGCSWNPAGAGELLAIAQGLVGRVSRVFWVCFAAIC